MSAEGSDLVESAGNLQIKDDNESEDSPGGEEQKLPDIYPWPGLYYGTEIKRMISHTLKGWCSHEPKPKIYIVTPFIDRIALEMIKDSIRDHKIEALYTRDTSESPLGPKMKGILKKKDFVKLRVGRPDQGQYYHCKFVAAEFPDHVEILMTSANLESRHFFPGQIDSVHKYEVKPEAFKTEYLEKLDGHSRYYEWPIKRAASGKDKAKQQKKGAP